jgi:hypothetical protein
MWGEMIEKRPELNFFYHSGCQALSSKMEF